MNKYRKSANKEGGKLMKVEKLDAITINVKDLDEAIRSLSNLFETTFYTSDTLAENGVKAEVTITGHADPSTERVQSRDAMSPIGLEVLQTIPPVEREGVRAIAFKVSNLGEAKEEMKKKGVRHIKDIKIGGFREAVFHPDDVHGIRLCLYQYQAPTIVDAYLGK